ncbi:MAG: hypothetical protein E7201_02100 [Selenomonas ruminantium]|uniref:Uncharacterized protein n=1 Tax=Selenomonas ruminantium TaxID=971 RepID=A0A927WHH6_SELRU|nr:hypothetical protein [Selenomonas ruminantium]
MDELLRQITAALDNRLYFIALQATLTLPAICAELESDAGAKRKRGLDGIKYRKWYNENVFPKHLTAKECYDFRCSLLHDGSSFRGEDKKGSMRRILFVYPNPMLRMDNVKFCNMGNADNATCIDIHNFCHDMMNSVKIWNDKVKDSPNYQKNYDKFFKLHINGIPPYVVGMPVIG